MLVNSSMLSFARLPPTLWRAALSGSNTVKSAVLSTVSVKFNVASAPTAEVRLRATAVAETLCGSVRSRLITWMVPPENGIEVLTTNDL